MTARALRGVDMIRDATLEAPPAIHVLILKGLPRTGLSVKEFATITGYPEWRIKSEIRNGRLRADRTGQSTVIPVEELAVTTTWADYEGPQT